MSTHWKSRNVWLASYNHPNWQRKRLEILKRDEFKCLDCEAADKKLNVHHDYYVKGREVWDYPNFSLSTLCDDCHKARHEEKPEEGMSQMQEWEREMDWILNGVPALAGRLWYLAAAIAQAVHPECDATRRALELFVDARIVESQMQEATE